MVRIVKKRIAAGWCAVVLGATAFCGEHAHAQDDIRPFALANVVRIEAPTTQSQPERGYGLIVGREGDTLWVATAMHVVRWRTVLQDNLDYSPQIAVFLQGRTDALRLVSRPVFHDVREADIAFLPVHAPLDGRIVENWHSFIVASRIQPDEAVSLLGSRRDSVEIDAATGKVGSASLENGSAVLRLAGPVGVPGQSGAPVATRNGVLGLYLGAGVNGPSDALVASINEIRRAAEKRSIRWQLEKVTVASDYLTQACLTLPAKEHPDIRIGGTTISGLSTTERCVSLPAGRHKLASLDPEVSCTPATLQLAEVPTQRVQIECHVEISGYWTSTMFGGAQVSTIASGAWKLEGMDLSPYGRLEGRLSGQPPEMFFDGRTAADRPISGQVIVERGILKFSLVTTNSGTRLSGQLERPLTAGTQK